MENIFDFTQISYNFSKLFRILEGVLCGRSGDRKADWNFFVAINRKILGIYRY